MILRKVLSTLVACSFFFLAVGSVASVTSAQDLSNTVIPITGFHVKVKPRSKFLPGFSGWGALEPKIVPALETDFGTGFCLDPECRFIGTNYHVAVYASPGKIKGDQVVQRYLGTGPDDQGATLNDFLSERPMKYNLIRDLAIFELRHPLPHYHGIAFSLADLELDQPVEIYAYPKKLINPIRSLRHFHGVFKGQTPGVGLLAFMYDLSNGEGIRPGASGGLVIDSKSQRVIGVLSRLAVGRNGEPVVLAVPIQSLADFVSRVQPWLAQRIFPSAQKETIRAGSGDIYPKLVWPPTSASLQHRPEEPPEVKLLRERGQQLADSIRNFIAVQTYEWGKGSSDVPAAEAKYQVRVVDGVQRFRQYPDGDKESDKVAYPRINAWILPADEWSKLPKFVGTELRLKIRQAEDAVVNDRRVKVFQYSSSVEDDLCPFAWVDDFVLFTVTKPPVAVACYGEVWTDQGMNILRISENLDFSSKLKAYGGMEDCHVVITYGWLQPAEGSRRLVPLTILTESRDKKHTYWCRGYFTDYHVFVAHSRVRANQQN